jgi:hypothetical protein
VHCAGIFGRLPLARTDDGIGRFASCGDNCLNVLFVHEPVNGRARSLFSLKRNRLLKIFIHLGPAYNNACAVDQLNIALHMIQACPVRKEAGNSLLENPGKSYMNTC